MSLLGSIQDRCGSQAFIHLLSLFLQEKSAQKVSFSPKLHCHWKGVRQTKSNSSSYHSNEFKLVYFCSNGVLELLWKARHPQKLSHMRVTAKVGALKVLLDHSQEGLELVTDCTDSVYYLMHRWARFLPGILGVVLDPTVPTEAFFFFCG